MAMMEMVLMVMNLQHRFMSAFLRFTNSFQLYRPTVYAFCCLIALAQHTTVTGGVGLTAKFMQTFNVPQVSAELELYIYTL